MQTLEEANNVIFRKIEIGDYCIVHIKDTMEPKIFDLETKLLYTPPTGYMEYDNDNFARRKAIV